MLAYTNLTFIAPTADVCDRSAQLRAAWAALRTPDALHRATALAGSATAFITNDRRIPASAGIDVLLLGRL
ncbi:MAG: type II toxin-antitoxin system VapC family toxin [Chloroflexota bacterium]